MVPKPYYLHVGFNWIHSRGLLCPLQAGPSRTWRLCFDMVTETFQNQRPLALLVYRPRWGECQRWLWGAGRGRGAQLTLFLAFPNQSSLPFLPAQPCCWFFFLSWVFALFVEQVFLCGSHFFLYRGKLGFFREPYLVSPSLFSSLNLCKRLWPPSSPERPEGCHPSSWARGVTPPRGRAH